MNENNPFRIPPPGRQAEIMKKIAEVSPSDYKALAQQELDTLLSYFQHMDDPVTGMILARAVVAISKQALETAPQGFQDATETYIGGIVEALVEQYFTVMAMVRAQAEGVRAAPVAGSSDGTLN